MIGETGVQPYFLLGKVSHFDEVSVTILLETGQKILWPKKKFPKELHATDELMICISWDAQKIPEKDKDKVPDAKNFINVILQSP